MADILKRWRWAIAITALLLAGLAWAFWPAATAVDLGEVSRGPMREGVTDDGVTRAIDVFTVSAPVTGYLARVELEPGDTIVSGTLITTMTGRPSAPLDTRSRDELRGALAGARAAEAGTQASLGQARRDLKRAEELASRGFLARAQLEAARTRVATGSAALRQSRAEARRIEALLAQPRSTASGTRVAVNAPASGSVLTVIKESEGVIAEGTPLMEIGDPQRIEAVVDLLSREAVRVKPGDRVLFGKYAGDEVKLDGVEHIILKESDVLAIIDPA